MAERCVTIPIEDVRVGDLAQFRGGPRRVERVLWGGGIAVVQLYPGRIGGESWWKRTDPDGERLTLYMASDLPSMGVTHAKRILSHTLAAEPEEPPRHE